MKTHQIVIEDESAIIVGNSPLSENFKFSMLISDEQLVIIEMFAHTRKDSDLNTVYKMNDCEFRILPIFKAE